MGILGQISISSVAIGAVVAAIVVIVIQQIIAKANATNLTQKRKDQLESANREAENIIKSAKLDVAEELVTKREKFNAEMTQMQSQLRNQERRLSKREDVMDRQGEQLVQREKQLKDG
ncbi:MAG: DUF3552 domain-containing protein, partial [Planctomycetes bacterium]|nr:DUF3552 domain-containing protein [Planctomycetota bacterium]